MTYADDEQEPKSRAKKSTPGGDDEQDQQNRQLPGANANIASQFHFAYFRDACRLFSRFRFRSIRMTDWKR